jgi:hypothetical protein
LKLMIYSSLPSIACQDNSGYDCGMDDNTYECPSCGGSVYPEQTRCPQCGHNMYPEEEAPSITKDESESTRWGIALGALLIGWMIASGIAAIFHFTIDSFISPFMPGSFGKFLLFIAGPVGSLVGGLVCAGLVRQNKKILGGLVGAFAIPVSLLLTTHWVHVTLDLLLSPLFLVEGLLIIFAGIAGAWLNQKFSQTEDWKEKWKVRGWEDLLYQDLLRKVRFNGSAADRLIEYERRQEPQASRLKLIQNAIERWERDNR